MNKIYTFNVILTYDQKTQTNYILSSHKDEIYFPFFEISNTRYLFNETRTNIKNLFHLNTIRFIEEIIVSYIDIQNEFLLDYITQLDSKQFNLDNDVFVLCSTILTSRFDSVLSWNKFNYELNLQKPDIKTAVIDFCIQRSIT